MAKMEGEVAKFGTKGYGFIAGDDDEQYFVHQKNIFNKSRLKTGARVVFNVENSDKGWVATDVELASGGGKMAAQSRPLSNGVIKGLFTVLFITQAAVIYQVFLGQ